VATRPKKPKPSNHDELVERLEHIEEELHEMGRAYAEQRRRLVDLQLHFDQFAGSKTSIEMLREMIERVETAITHSSASVEQSEKTLSESSELLRKLTATLEAQRG
jgi:uncharacterized coiled-coil DUF342 family protein